MRITIKLKNKESNSIILPKSYSHLLQSFIFNLVDNQQANSFLHDKGYQFNNRNYKPFCFSHLLGNFKIVGKNLAFSGESTLIVSSFDQEFINSITTTCIIKDDLFIGQNKIEVTSFSCNEEKLDKSEYIVKTLSPFFLYSTFNNMGSSLRHFYSPNDKKNFNIQVNNNLRRKAQAFFGKDWDDKSIEILPIFVAKKTELYKQGVYECYNGTFRIKGDIDLINLVYDVGLGMGNGKGFGLLEFINKEDLNVKSTSRIGTSQ